MRRSVLQWELICKLHPDSSSPYGRFRSGAAGSANSYIFIVSLCILEKGAAM
jgi:hypothetical protein